METTSDHRPGAEPFPEASRFPKERTLMPIILVDDFVDIIFENVGSPSCTDHAKHTKAKEELFRNAADALLGRFYNSAGSFEIAKGYCVIIVVVLMIVCRELSVYTVNIK
ncbi:unnamed protein product [Mortierella alpina]